MNTKYTGPSRERGGRGGGWGVGERPEAIAIVSSSRTFQFLGVRQIGCNTKAFHDTPMELRNEFEVI